MLAVAAKKPKKKSQKCPPPFETSELRRCLSRFLATPFSHSDGGEKVGDFKWGVYAFYDYDGEPIYVGQTNEKLRVRIRRHLTNQRTDAVAMSVLDPFEVDEVEVWPLANLQETSGTDIASKRHLDALEALVYRNAVEKSEFKAVLNEKNPPTSGLEVELPPSYRASIVSAKVREMRQHPDVRIARRALTISRLAQVISERQVQAGLRRVLVTQAERLRWLASQQLEACGGEQSVEVEAGPYADD